MKALIPLLMLLPAYAQATTGNELLGYCEADLGTFKSGLCTGFIDGVISGYSIGHSVGTSLGAYDVQIRLGIDEEKAGKEADAISDSLEKHDAGYCRRSGLTNGQIRDVVVKYLRENPNTRDLSAQRNVMRAMRSAFPVIGCN